MSAFAVIFKAKETRSGLPGNPVVTRAGSEFIVAIEPDGWVEATSLHVPLSKELPEDLKTWKTADEAERFMKRWKGHPWYARPESWRVIEVEEITKTVVTGYREKKS